jgi:hypothetical protein
MLDGQFVSAELTVTKSQFFLYDRVVLIMAKCVGITLNSLLILFFLEVLFTLLEPIIILKITLCSKRQGIHFFCFSFQYCHQLFCD